MVEMFWIRPAIVCWEKHREKGAAINPTATAISRWEGEGGAACADQRPVATAAAEVPQEMKRRRAEQHRASAEMARGNADQLRLLGEEARALAEQHRMELETVRQDREALRDAAEEARQTAEKARHATIAAVAATADPRSASLAKMQFLANARRMLRKLTRGES
jgi:hypothetical protein